MPNYEVIIPALLAHGIDELPKHASLTAGVPVKPYACRVPNAAARAEASPLMAH